VGLLLSKLLLLLFSILAGLGSQVQYWTKWFFSKWLVCFKPGSQSHCTIVQCFDIRTTLSQCSSKHVSRHTVFDMNPSFPGGREFGQMHVIHFGYVFIASCISSSDEYLGHWGQGELELNVGNVLLLSPGVLSPWETFSGVTMDIIILDELLGLVWNWVFLLMDLPKVLLFENLPCSWNEWRTWV
jgi:hypothetical protein